MTYDVHRDQEQLNLRNQPNIMILSHYGDIENPYFLPGFVESFMLIYFLTHVVSRSQIAWSGRTVSSRLAWTSYSCSGMPPAQKDGDVRLDGLVDDFLGFILLIHQILSCSHRTKSPVSPIVLSMRPHLMYPSPFHFILSIPLVMRQVS